MSRVVHFEIQAEDVERAKAFYADVFGWTYEDYSQMVGSPYFGIVTGSGDEPGINGGLLPRPAATPGEGQGTNAFVCTMGVGDYDVTEQKILEAGGRGGAAQVRAAGDGVAGVLPGHRGQHVRDPPAGPRGPLIDELQPRASAAFARLVPAAQAQGPA